MKNYFFLTGSSRGLGRAIADELLKDDSNIVFGFSRLNSIVHANFYFVELDLSDTEAVAAYSFPDLSECKSIVLINNAGVIGEIKQVGKKEASKIDEVYRINTVAPSLLMNQFIKQYQNIDVQKQVLNISSGAGRHSITSWAEYCASKSAIDMYSLVVQEEQQKQKFPFKIYSLAPGIIDTDMQTEIRLSKQEEFEMLDYFVDLKRKQLLSSSSDIARKLLGIIDNPQHFKEGLLDVRDF